MDYGDQSALMALSQEWRADLASREAWMASEKAMLVRAERAEAALERARALWARWRDMLCLYDELEPFVEVADAALLATGSGGAA